MNVPEALQTLDCGGMMAEIQKVYTCVCVCAGVWKNTSIPPLGGFDMRNHSLKSMAAKIEAEYQLPLVEVVRGFIVNDGVSLADTAAILEVKHSALLAYCRIKGIGGQNAARKGKAVEAARSETRAITIRQLRRDQDQISFARLSDILGIGRDCIRKRFNNLGDLREAVSHNFQPRRPGRPSREK